MNKILFIYSDNSEKSLVALLEDALKAVLRKFRKSVSFSKVLIDMSVTCRDAMSEILSESISTSDGVLWLGNKKQSTVEENFALKCLNAYSKEYISGGKCICSPFCSFNAKLDDESISLNVATSISDIQHTVKIAVDAAKERNKRILLCTDTSSPYDTMLAKEMENSISDARSFDIDYCDFDELIYTLSRKVVPCDSVLCSEDKAHIIAVNMNSLNKFPVGYTVWHCEKARIYRREFLPYENSGNLSYASMLIAAGNMLEKELGFKGAGIHLKKAAARTLEKCFSAHQDEFHRQLLFEINVPIRNRQVNKNDSNN